VILESAGVGQSDASITEHCDVSLYVMTPEYGAASQLEKINMLDYADVIALNKSDKAGAQDALHDVRKQYKRNHQKWEEKDEDLPIVPTISSQFNDHGVNVLFKKVIGLIEKNKGIDFGHQVGVEALPDAKVESVIPARRVRYLSEISDEVRKYNRLAREQSEIASVLYKLTGTLEVLKNAGSVESLKDIEEQIRKYEKKPQ
jgi:methylmalonyl-CoA mutase